MADFRNNENAEMVINNNNQIKHHTEELEKIVTPETEVPAWVVSKVGRSASDLSDATHYLDGVSKMKYADGGDVSIAKTIISQLGGMGRLNAMTGAYNFVAIPNGVSFRIKNARANYIKITLSSLDLYDLEVGRIRGDAYKVVEKKDGLYADMLKSAIERATGMRLTLFADGGGVEEDKFGYKDFYRGQGIKFKTEEEAKRFIKSAKPFVRKQLREGNFALVFNGKEYFIGEKYADGGVAYDPRWSEMEAYSPYMSRREYDSQKEYDDLTIAAKTFSKSAEMLVKENLIDGEICVCKLKKILGHYPAYPVQYVGSIKLTKCFLKPFYKI